MEEEGEREVRKGGKRETKERESGEKNGEEGLRETRGNDGRRVTEQGEESRGSVQVTNKNPKLTRILKLGHLNASCEPKVRRSRTTL